MEIEKQNNQDSAEQPLIIDGVSVSFNYIPITPLTELEKQLNISTHDAAIRTLEMMDIPKELIKKKN